MLAVGSTSGSGTTLLGLIAAGDIDAAAGFFDGRATTVREYCRQLCRPDVVDEATLSAFADFRARAVNMAPDADAEDVLRRAARTAAAARMELYSPRSDVCRGMPELLAARTNRELTHSDEALERHLKRCATCRQTVEWLADAEAALTGPGGDPPPDEVRVAWLELVGESGVAEPAIPAGTHATGDNGAGRAWTTSTHDDRVQSDPEPAPLTAAATPPEEQPAASATRQADREPIRVVEPEPAPGTPPADPQPGTVRVRGRRGGLVGAAKRLASGRRHQ
jgi:hypothetical protein